VAVKTVVEERRANGLYKDLSDFSRRFDATALNKRNLETMAVGGAFDALEANRALVHGNIDQVVGLGKRLAESAATGIADLFGGSGGGTKMDMRPAKMWTPTERLAEEFKAVGFYLSGHPLDEYANVLPKLNAIPFAQFERKAGLGSTAGRLAAIVVSARERRSQKGNKFAFAMFSDATGQFEAVLFSDTLEQCRALLEPGTPVLLNVEAERDGETVKMRVQSMEKLDRAAANVQRGLKIVLDERLIRTKRASLTDIKQYLRPVNGRGGATVEMWLRLYDMEREIKLDMPGKFDISPSDAGVISTVPGVLEVTDI
jgi:DNA polymerase III subunit alpha